MLHSLLSRLEEVGQIGSAESLGVSIFFGDDCSFGVRLVPARMGSSV